MLAVGSTIRQRQDFRMWLWFFARIQTRAPFLRRPNGVHVFPKRKADTLPDDINSSNRPSSAKGLIFVIYLLFRVKFWSRFQKNL